MNSIRPIDLADLCCDFCGAPAYASEQLCDPDFVDAVAAFRRQVHDIGIPACLCTACQGGLHAALRRAPQITVPLDPP